jgi:hypothetical protein
MGADYVTCGPPPTPPKRVTLWEAGGVGLIVSSPTGVVYTNQCGGTCCSHPELEGFYVPLSTNEPESPDPLYDMWGDYEWHESDATQFLRDNDLFEYFKLDDTYEGNIGEAWVPVIILKNDNSALQDLEGMHGVITYQNSD